MFVVRLTLGLTVFLGGVLIFLVQPLMVKKLVPWFGGSPATWTASVIFFQTVLLAGYAYSHASVRRLSGRTQRVVHLLLLAIGLLLMTKNTWRWQSSILPPDGFRPSAQAPPVASLLWLLTVTVGLPTFLLSAASPLAQAWLVRRERDAGWTRYYALSNAGSFLGLLGYPLLLQPAMALSNQARVWFLLFLLFTFSMSLFALLTRGAGKNPAESTESPPRAATTPTTVVQWLVLPGVASLLMLAITNQLSEELAAVPLLWVLPLSIYLVTLVLTFEAERWYRRNLFLALLTLVSFRAISLISPNHHSPIWSQIVVYSTLMFAGGMICHGELVRLRPGPEGLTRFYLVMALGSVLGSSVVTFVAPLAFDGFWELPLGIWLTFALIFWNAWFRQHGWLARGSERLVFTSLSVCSVLLLSMTAVHASRADDEAIPTSLLLVFAFGALILLLAWSRYAAGWTASRRRAVMMLTTLLVLGTTLSFSVRLQRGRTRLAVRNFYGLAKVLEQNRGHPNAHRLALVHGETLHGAQYQAPRFRNEPVSYYGPTSGLGRVLLNHPRRTERGLRIGGIGLGAGTMTAYGRPQDRFVIYELNPSIVRLSRGADLTFTYVQSSLSPVEIRLGDGRLELEQEWNQSGPREFDLLVVDAFTGAAIPTHLLTHEALRIYLTHLARPDGVLLFHITNHNLDLRAVVQGIARFHGLRAGWIDDPGRGERFERSSWMIVPLNEKLLDAPGLREFLSPLPEGPAPPTWSDSYTNLLAVLRW